MHYNDLWPWIPDQKINPLDKLTRIYDDDDASLQATHPPKKQRLSKPQRDTRPKQMPEGVFPTKFKQKLKHLPSPIRCPRPLVPFPCLNLKLIKNVTQKSERKEKGIRFWLRLQRTYFTLLFVVSFLFKISVLCLKYMLIYYLWV